MKKALIFGVTCVLLLVALTADSMAQGRGQGGGGGGRGGGFGGRGMSRMMLLRAEPVQKALDLSDETTEKIQAIIEENMPAPGGGGGFCGRGMSRMMLLRAEPIQKALDLSDETVEKIQAIIEENMPAPGQGGGRPDPEAMAKAEEEVLGLLDDKQKKRLLGIYAQAAGARALLDDNIAKELEIDDDLKAEIQGKLDDMAAGMREKMQEIMAEAGDDRQAAMEKMQAMRADMDKEVIALLSDSQKKAFEELKGEK
ncbi:MAG: hypothetical protein ACK5Z0_06265, partial [Planctomycetota bacterium]